MTDHLLWLLSGITGVLFLGLALERLFPHLSNKDTLWVMLYLWFAVSAFRWFFLEG